MDRGSHSSRSISPEEWESAVYRLRLHLEESTYTEVSRNVETFAFFFAQKRGVHVWSALAHAPCAPTPFFPHGGKLSRQMHIRIGCLLGRAPALLPRTLCPALVREVGSPAFILSHWTEDYVPCTCNQSLGNNTDLGILACHLSAQQDLFAQCVKKPINAHACPIWHRLQS